MINFFIFFFFHKNRIYPTLRIFKDSYYLFKLLNTHVGNLGKKALSVGIEVLFSELFIVYSKKVRVFWISRYLGIYSLF